MIRIGTPEDLPAIAAFDPFRGDRPQELAAGSVLVAEDGGGQVVGYVTFSPAGFIGRPFVHFLAVAPASRRQGVARTLLHAVAARVGPCRLFISTEEDNAPMLRLLEQDGWTAAGCVRHVNENGAAECFFCREVGAGDR